MIFISGTSTILPCCETLCHVTWANGSTCSVVPPGKLPFTCVTAGRPHRMSCPPAITETTGRGSHCTSSWTALQTWPTTGRCACWPISAWWAATTSPPWTRASATPFSWPAPRVTWRTWPSTAWRSSSARRSTCSSTLSVCGSFPLSHRSTARVPPMWSYVMTCADALRNWISWICSCMSSPRNFSCRDTSSSSSVSGRRRDWRGEKRDAGSGSAESTRTNSPVWKTNLRSPQLRTMPAKWSIGDT